MATVALELHDELNTWLESIAATRKVSLCEAIHQLLEEERMRKLGRAELEVPIGDGRWRAKMPFRGLIYEGYDTRWERVA